MAERNVETDIAVIGAGGCGLSAALAAADSGKRVLLLERAEAPGGSTALSAGLFVAAGSQLQQASGELGSPDELAADIFRLNGGQSDRALTLGLCRASGPLIDWLSEQGVPLEHLPDYKYPGMSRGWIVATPQRHGAAITEVLHRLIERHSGVALHLRTSVTSLFVSDGPVWHLTATTPEGPVFRVQTSAVILAASGFAGNPDLVSRYIPEMAGAAYFGAPFATGDAIEWGQACGGTVAHMGAYQSHSSIAFPEMMLVTTYLINHGAIQVNQAGNRFGDETDTYARHAIAVQQQPGRTAVEVFDERILRLTLQNYPRFQECQEAGIVHSADTLAELAELFGLNPEALKATVAAYNGRPAGEIDEFGRARSGSPLTPPFHGIRVTSALVQTLGGLRVDSRARVLKSAGTPIHGLYAGGGSAAGLAGDRPDGYLAGTGLLAAFGLGWIAGREAAQV